MSIIYFKQIFFMRKSRIFMIRRKVNFEHFIIGIE